MSGTISFATLDSIEVNYDWLSANHYKKLNEPFTYAPHTTTDAPMGVGDYVTVESLSGQSHDGLYRVRNRGADGYDQASDYRWIRSLVGLDLGCSSGIDCGIGTGKIKLSHPPQKTYTGAFYHENFHDGFGEVLAFRTSGANDLMPGDHVYIKSSEGMPWEVVGKVIHHTADDQGNLDTVINIGLRSPCVVSALPRKYCSVEGTVALIPAPILLRNNRIITETGDVEAIELDLIQ
ncbi:MAG: hypothetical protein KBC84_08705 [Proteobacteria bacterium]|nr:hypothetical protein [Pseudomonadota bacterium]